MSYSQCFICRQWSHMGSKSTMDVWLCLPCYVDVLQVREKRGGQIIPEPEGGPLGEGPDQGEPRPSPYTQGELFEIEKRVDRCADCGAVMGAWACPICQGIRSVRG